MTLRDWLLRRKMSQRQFAKLIGWPEGPVSRYLAGKRCPGVHHALEIQRATAGEVSIEEWDRPRRKGGAKK